jgi:tetratricopeptide (TPR) repeat protein
MSTTARKRRPSRRRNKRRLAALLALSFTLTGAAKPKKGGAKPKPSAVEAEPRPLSDQSFEEILASYSFVGDLEQKEAERGVSDEIFWRYPYVLPKVDFPIEIDFTDPAVELPATRGTGRPIDHLNRGRMHFLQGEYKEAKGAWLTGRARYGKEYPGHRRSDYFVSYVFLQLARELMKTTGKPYDDQAVKGQFANAATFLEWAFVVKADQPDPLLEKVTPKGLYNLAAVKWRYGRYAGSFGAAEAGLNFLRKTGRKDYRPQFHRIIAESYIQNRSYLEAVQTLDQAIRQDVSRPQAAASFARVGDVYFDLNNYELAEDAYALGARIDEDLKQMSPAQLVLRGESLFWLGKFSEAQTALHHALEGAAFRQETAPLPEEFRPWAALRIADSFLARAAEARGEVLKLGFAAIERGDRDELCAELEDPKSKTLPAKVKPPLARYCNLIEKAKLEYYRVGHDYRSVMAGRLAQVRSGCLELPYYGGNNVKHTRELLEQAKSGELPPMAVELGWACQVGSYTQRERTPEMLERVKKFHDVYPKSRFLASFVEPVREFQARKIDPYFQEGDTYRALAFFEANRKSLYPKVDAAMAARLFIAYTDVYKPEKAKEFWREHHQEEPDTDLRVLREAIVAAELVDKRAGKEWEQRNAHFAGTLQKRDWKLAPGKQSLNYVHRFLQVSSLDDHLDWLMILARRWSVENTDYACDLELPLLSRAYAVAESKTHARVLARLSEMIDAKLPELFKADGSCALSMLELEQKIMRRKRPVDEFGKPLSPSGPSALAARYVARQSWPLVGDFLHMFWTIAEHLNDDGDPRSAKLMWQVLRDKGPIGAPETQFAKARLDPTRTELEKMWD